jgi:hypothetical protein
MVCLALQGWDAEEGGSWAMGAKGAGKRGRETDLFGEADANERGRFHNGIESSD